jgi:hypothetical protein
MNYCEMMSSRDRPRFVKDCTCKDNTAQYLSRGKTGGRTQANYTGVYTNLLDLKKERERSCKKLNYCILGRRVGEKTEVNDIGAASTWRIVLRMMSFSSSCSPLFIGKREGRGPVDGTCGEG